MDNIIFTSFLIESLTNPIYGLHLQTKWDCRLRGVYKRFFQNPAPDAFTGGYRPTAANPRLIIKESSGFPGPTVLFICGIDLYLRNQPQPVESMKSARVPGAMRPQIICEESAYLRYLRETLFKGEGAFDGLGWMRRKPPRRLAVKRRGG